MQRILISVPPSLVSQGCCHSVPEWEDPDNGRTERDGLEPDAWAERVLADLFLTLLYTPALIANPSSICHLFLY